MPHKNKSTSREIKITRKFNRMCCIFGGGFCAVCEYICCRCCTMKTIKLTIARWGCSYRICTYVRNEVNQSKVMNGYREYISWHNTLLGNLSRQGVI